MRMVSHNRLFQAAVVAAGIVAFSAGDAFAWKHRGGGSYGSYGGYASSGSYASYGSYGSGGSYASYGDSGGSHGRQGLFARWHARKAAKHSYGGNGSYGSHGSYGGYAYASSGSSGSYGYNGSSGSSGSYGGYAAPETYESAPMEGAPMDAVPPEIPAPSASIRVTVPADALVFVNDRPTTSTGSERNYVSRGLTTGRTYAYQLRVEFSRDGEKIVENKLVRLQAGEELNLSFGDGEQLAAEDPATTELTLHLPAGATVTLAGAATHQTGDLRTYATDVLSAGQTWDGYVVRVELERDGRTLSQEKTLDIVGGEQYELNFDFADDGAQVASLD